MSIRFHSRYNKDVDELVMLANERMLNHDGEYLFVKLHEDVALVNDTLTEDEKEPDIIDFSNFGFANSFSSNKQISNYSVPIVAVDSGVIDLGELANGGTVFAIRGSAICYPPNNDRPIVYRYNTGALALDNQNSLQVLHFIGNRLGKSDLFVRIIPSSPYFKPKDSMAETSNQLQDRCRNFVERMIQEEAIAILKNYGGGILLLDGALTGGTFDTPETYMKNMLDCCRGQKINVVAISKKTRITVGRVPISNLFADQPDFVGYAPLTTILEEERDEFMRENPSSSVREAVSIADEIYAVRFCYPPTGLTFRVDVHRNLALRSSEVLDVLFSQCQIYGGYPRSLIEAHQFSSFLFQDVQLLLADITVRLGVKPQEPATMEVLFQPFGGNFK